MQCPNCKTDDDILGAIESIEYFEVNDDVQFDKPAGGESKDPIRYFCKSCGEYVDPDGPKLERDTLERAINEIAMLEVMDHIATGPSQHFKYSEYDYDELQNVFEKVDEHWLEYLRNEELI